MKYLLPLFLCILLAACGQPIVGSPENVETPVITLDGTRGTLESLNGHEVLAGTTITIKFDSGKVSGYAGCNYFTDAEYTLRSKQRLTFKPFPITEMLCSEREGVMQQEEEFLQALRSVASYSMDETTFSLADEQGKVILQYQFPPRFAVNPKDLLGISWHMTGISYQLASGSGLMDVNMNSFTIQFDEGKFSGSTVCGDYAGTYEADQDSLRIIGWSGASNCSDITENKAAAAFTNLLTEVWQYNLTPTRLYLYTERGGFLEFSSGPPESIPSPESTATPTLIPMPTMTNTPWLSLLPSPTPSQIPAPVSAPATLNVRGRIDGISYLVVKGSTLRWYHQDFSAPGRWIEAPTYVNGVEWQPTWPDVPDRQNANCQCYSSLYEGIPAIANYPPVKLEIVQARGMVTITQQPEAGNGYTLMVEFDDVVFPDKTYGDEWYEINLSPTNMPVAQPPTPTLGVTPNPDAIQPGNIAQLRELGVIESPGWLEAITFSPDGSILARAGSDGIWLYGLDQKKDLIHFKGHTQQIHAVAFSPDGQRLYSGGVDEGGGRIRAWDWQTGTELWSVVAAPPGWGAWITVSPDGKIMMSTGAFVSAFWQIQETGLQREQQFEGGGRLAFSPDGRMLVYGSDLGYILRGFGGNQKDPLLLNAPGIPAYLFPAFSPDSTLIAGGAEKGTLKVWKSSDGSILYDLKGDSDWVEVAVFSPDGSLLASKSQDGSVRLWRTSDGSLLRSLAGFQGQNSRLAFSPNGEILAITNGGNVHLWGVVPY